MSDENTIGLRPNPNAQPVSVEVEVRAKVIPLRPAYERRGKYKELRALIDAGRNVEVSFEPLR